MSGGSSNVLEPGERHKLSIKVTNPPKGTQPIEWRTKDKKIASVDQSGWVTAVSLGETTITGTSGNKSVKAKITVRAAWDIDSDQTSENTEEPGNESPEPAEPDYMPQIPYRAHVENEGWQDWKSGGETAGTTGGRIRAESKYIVLNRGRCDLRKSHLPLKSLKKKGSEITLGILRFWFCQNIIKERFYVGLERRRN